MDYEKKEYYKINEEYKEYNNKYETELYILKKKEPYQWEIREVKKRAMICLDFRI